MTDWDPIQAYVMELARRLPRQGHRTDRVLAEIEDHLRETVDELSQQGMDPADAAAHAVERFGTPPEILRRFELEAPFENEVLKMNRMILTPTIVLTTVCAGLFFFFAWFDDAPAPVLAVKVLLSAAVIGYNLIVLHELWAAKQVGPWEHWLAFGGALTSIAVGSAAFVWTAHLGLVSGDWEGYGFAAGGLLILQGVLATMQLVRDGKPPVNLAA